MNTFLVQPVSLKPENKLNRIYNFFKKKKIYVSNTIKCYLNSTRKPLVKEHIIV